MIDALTNEIINQINNLPIIKKKAILELIRKDRIPDDNTDIELQQKWRKSLLTTSVWTDSQINEIYQAREYINKWQPKQLF
ncbi:hypothetical protein H8E88_35020 [candidate division KSB1 bacterium]|nr:hypothetical protein [candidate division KSB1 bacterium]